MRKIYPVVIGLGYVGLPIFLNLQENFKTVGFDINKKRIHNLKNKKDYNKEFTHKDLKLKKKSIFTNKLKDIKKGNFYIIAVPTPVNKKNIPNLELLKKSCKFLSKVIKKNDIIFFESTVYPTVTDKICIPILKKSGMRENRDFYVGYSPERINPGDKTHTLTKIKKITSGSNKETAMKVDKLYSSIINAGTYCVSIIDQNQPLCQLDTCFIITESAALNIAETITNVDCNGDSTGAISLVVTGGVVAADYNYNWVGINTGFTSTNGNINNLIADQYSIVVTDDDGCEDSTAFDVTENNALTVTPSSTDAACGLNNGDASVVVAGGVVATDYVYSWEDNTGTVISTSSSISAVGSGTYQVFVNDDLTSIFTLFNFAS